MPVGLGVKLAERSDSKFYDKGNVRSKQLLGIFFSTNIFIFFILLDLIILMIFLEFVITFHLKMLLL